MSFNFSSVDLSRHKSRLFSCSYVYCVCGTIKSGRKVRGLVRLHASVGLIAAGPIKANAIFISDSAQMITSRGTAGASYCLHGEILHDSYWNSGRGIE